MCAFGFLTRPRINRTLRTCSYSLCEFVGCVCVFFSNEIRHTYKLFTRKVYTFASCDASSSLMAAALTATVAAVGQIVVLVIAVAAS